jgi:hypothetical protein
MSSPKRGRLLVADFDSQDNSRSASLAAWTTGCNPVWDASMLDYPMNVSHIHTKEFWERCCDSNGWVPLTVVLPTGRCKQSTSHFLAVSSDALYIPEICLLLDRHVRNFGFNGLLLKSFLDIDLHAVHGEDLSENLKSNLLLMGTPDINPLTQDLINATYLQKAYPNRGFRYPYDHSLYGMSRAYRLAEYPFVGLFALFPNFLAGDGTSFAMVCGGESATGTMASLYYLRHIINCEKCAQNNKYDSSLPIKFIDGKPREYRSDLVKAYMHCSPQVDLVNVKRFRILE